MKILIIEDDPMVAMIHKEYFKRKEISNDLNHVSTLEEAKEFLANSDTDLIILDNYLADGQGIEFLPELKGYPIIMITAANDVQTVEAALTNGVVDYLCTREMSRKFDYKVRIMGCSPYKIIGVTAAAIDYGIGQNEVMGFIRYIAISTCRENDVEVVRNWVEANIGNESSETTIGGITFLLSHSGRSTTLQVSVEEKNILAN